MSIDYISIQGTPELGRIIQKELQDYFGDTVDIHRSGDDFMITFHDPYSPEDVELMYDEMWELAPLSDHRVDGNVVYWSYPKRQKQTGGFLGRKSKPKLTKAYDMTPEEKLDIIDILDSARQEIRRAQDKLIGTDQHKRLVDAYKNIDKVQEMLTFGHTF